MLIDLIHKMKRETPRRVLAFNGDRGVRGGLVAVGDRDWEDAAFVSQIMSWREAHKAAFATRMVHPTAEKTRGYLERLAYARADRILFRLIDQVGDTVGHVGLASITPAEADIDNLMLGRADLGLEFIFQAELALMRFAFGSSAIESIGADVLDTNMGAQLLHRVVGFKVSAVTPLDSDISSAGDEALRPARDPAAPTSAIRNLRLSFTRRTFFEKYSLVLAVR